MKPRVKLLTPWVGKPPWWLPHFRERVAASRSVDWEMVEFQSEADVLALAESSLGALCLKENAYAALCDLRPFYGVMFADRYAGYDYWGWCDVDVVFGDLDRFFLEALDRYDVVTLEYYVLCGGMTALRNRPDVCRLYESGPWREVLATPGYVNFDEGGRGGGPAGRGGVNAGGFTGVVNSSGLAALYDDRSWSEGRDMLGRRRPSRTCYLEGRRLIEHPTEREIFLYHLGSKRWPNLEHASRWHEGPRPPPGWRPGPGRRRGGPRPSGGPPREAAKARAAWGPLHAAPWYGPAPVRLADHLGFSLLVARCGPQQWLGWVWRGPPPAPPGRSGRRGFGRESAAMAWCEEQAEQSACA